MWEFSLACENKNKKMLEYINNCFCADIPDCMLTTHKDAQYTYLLFACDEAIESICKDKVKQCIVTYIIDVFKYEYFMTTIVKTASPDLTLQAYIKALTLYDVDTDITLIKRSIEFENQFYLDSFLRFRLRDMLRMWRELCELVMSNINYLNLDMMIDVMRSFIATFNTSVSKLKIIINKDEIVLYRIDDNKPPIKLKDHAPAIDIINYTLLSNPDSIEIYGERNNDLINLLKLLYLEKVKIMD